MANNNSGYAEYYIYLLVNDENKQIKSRITELESKSNLLLEQHKILWKEHEQKEQDRKNAPVPAPPF